MKFNKSTALTIISIAGVTATTVVTAIMAPKAERAIKAKLADISTEEVEMTMTDGTAYFSTKPKEKLTKADKLELVKTAAPYYAPTIFLCILTIGTIILNHRVNKKELLALSATTSYLVANRNQLKKMVDKPEVKKLTKEMFKHQTIEETGNGDLLCIEGYSGRIFRSSPDAVIDAETKLIDQFLDEEHNGEFGYASMNDFYRYLGIEESRFGHDYGWVNNEDWYYRNEPIQFSNELVAEDAPGNEWGEPVYCIDIEDGWQPMWGYDQI